VKKIVLVLALVLLAAYFLAMHLTLTNAAQHHLAVLFAVVPLFGLGAVQLYVAMPARRWAVSSLLVLLLCALWWTRAEWWQWLVAQTERVYLLQHVGSMLFLAGFFAHSFKHPEGNWVTRLASIIHQGLSAKERAYTQTVGIAWVILFAALALASLMLYVFDSKTLWSALVNVFTWPIVGLAFVLEYAVRRWYLHDTKHISLQDTLTRVHKAWNEGLR
jgi:uncharacterized membrane protein